MEFSLYNCIRCRGVSNWIGLRKGIPAVAAPLVAVLKCQEGSRVELADICLFVVRRIHMVKVWRFHGVRSRLSVNSQQKP